MRSAESALDHAGSARRPQSDGYRRATDLIHLARRKGDGTIPANANLGGVVERLMAPVLKTGRAKALVGSNPTPSAISKHFRSSVNPSCHFNIRARRFERSSTGGTRYAPRLKSCLWIILQSQRPALD